MEFFIFCVIILICSYQSYRLGMKEGAEKTVKKLHQEKIISVAPDGDIKPNPFYIEKKTES